MAPKYPLSREQLDLIERFIAAQNAIEHHLRDYFGTSKHLAYTRMVREYARRNPSWRDEDTLVKYAQLRNVIVHDKLEAYHYLSVPVLHVVEEIEAIRDRFLNPERVYPQFKGDVITVQLSTSLSDVLKLISKHHFSQFPIYDADQFCGLLTENGITHWLADHTVETMTLVELAEVPVEAVLQNEEARANYQFVARHTLVDDVVAKFSDNIFLEAALITHSGKTSQRLLGMITRWDIMSKARGSDLLDEG